MPPEHTEHTSGSRRWLDRLRTVGVTVLLALVAAYPVVAAVLVATHASGTPPERIVSTLALVTLAAILVLALRRPFRVPPHDQRTHAVIHDDPLELPTWAYVAGALIAAQLIVYPRLDQITELIIGNTGDSALYLYLLEWQMHAFVAEPLNLLETNIFDPATFPLVWAPTFTPAVPFFATLRTLGAQGVLALNLLMVLVSFFTLVATFAFLRAIGTTRSAAVVGALLYATTGQALAHLSHLDSFQTLWIPVVALLLVRVFETRAVRDGLLLGGAVGVTVMMAPYYFVGFIVLIPATLVFAWRRLDREFVLPLAAGGVLAGAISSPILVLSRIAGIASRDELIPVHWADLLTPPAFAPATRPLWDAARSQGGGATIENWLFAGVPLAVLGAIGAVLYLRRAQEGTCLLPAGHPWVLPRLLSGLTLTGLVLGAGSYASIGPVGVPLPMALLRELPGFASVRNTGRFLAFAFLALTVLAVLGYNRLVSDRDARGRAAVTSMAVVAILALTATPYTRTPLPLEGDVTAVNRALIDEPEGTVIELPWPGCPGECLWTEPPRMVWSRVDWKPRLGGYSGHIPDYWTEVQAAVEGFPSPEAFQVLERFAVRYVVLRTTAGVDGARFAPAEAERIAAAASSAPEVAEVQRAGPDWLIVLEGSG